MWGFGMIAPKVGEKYYRKTDALEGSIANISKDTAGNTLYQLQDKREMSLGYWTLENLLKHWTLNDISYYAGAKKYCKDWDIIWLDE